MIFDRGAYDNLVVNHKDNSVFKSRNYRSDSCPLEIWCSLKLAYLSSKLRLSGKIFVLRTSNFRVATASSSVGETLYCLNRNLIINYNHAACEFSFFFLKFQANSSLVSNRARKSRFKILIVQSQRYMHLDFSPWVRA